MINIVGSTYYKEGEIQLMIPICDNCTLIGPDGVKFHSNYGKILINDYIQHPKRKLFPYHDIPTHKNDKGEFANQLFQLNQQYLAIYSSNGVHQFRTDTFFQVDQTVYDDMNVELELNHFELKEMSSEELKEKFQGVLSSNVFLCILDDDGELHEYRKNAFEFEIPLSGIGIFGDGTSLKAFIYQMQLNGEKISIKSQKLEFQHREQINLEGCTSIPEPIMHKR